MRPHLDLTIEHVAEDRLPNLFFLLQQMDLAVHMLEAIREIIPADITWRTTSTGDPTASTLPLSSTGHGRTIPCTRADTALIALADGSFDIIIPMVSLLTVPEWFEPDLPFERWVRWGTRTARLVATHVAATAREGDVPRDPHGRRSACPSSRSASSPDLPRPWGRGPRGHHG